MPVRDDLGTRMKEYYENVPKTRLTRRTPVAIRIDGKAFHTFTRGFKKPFDDILIKTMQDTAKYLCKNVQGCVFGYTQSDEITLILIDYQTLTTSAWFDYEVQKLCSISASMATMAFNKFFLANIDEAFNKTFFERGLDQGGTLSELDKLEEEFQIYYSKVNSAMFDARCFNIPKEEVTNLIYWRQLDAARNSVQMVGQANFSHKELQGCTCNVIQDMLHEQKGINWNDFPTYQKRGSAVLRNNDGEWYVDLDMPMLKNEARQYVDALIGEV